MSLTDDFFDRLDGMISSGKKPAELRGFAGPYRDQFAALERDAKAKNQKSTIKKAKTEIERLQTALENTTAEFKRLQAKFQEQQQIAEELRVELGRFTQAKRQWEIKEANQKEQIENLRRELDRVKQVQQPQSKGIAEDQIKLLVYLIAQGPQNKLSEAVIAGGAGVSSKSVPFHLKELHERGFAIDEMIQYSHPAQYRWKATHEGEKWARANGHIRD